ncbi:MAG: hypothetical protein A3G52_05075 [Candidatus Taylorbacteria bacterium RIFCSPLOWO2_12_FULL_43_20]|uniref:Uncharacterized protein n=1 Tax=Candidatus Taylorbacteria bacterium RIFCSPLOWO2_12_FULL_43_20 TaxID=1802332 RepID=A0A1G2NZ91_9BACT|nr:MAG: hypothetical protein A2825_03545 [Candidatus Taylorbacteria bacterium RIFCSPHIGHO2_01_FULL_43_120]OHA23788.1 MAG: hypothetical protein A3B98_03075 [Candidatus Taylorbacteria bacterium RIFCSPHIGHO2_02_FULL_43_55]OHA30242.1 MAG: hypothetical protein A3E92_01465 [Candidatus Taylorbacteria bacterium RIFCSPHIGHO2_12_FULL_42_34]OHA31992.1 MAG: hypothetical protein A3B09_01230 [Candidatus Taylorbacteria bacterium RIFCSPLOWO2_01_FULL_43_83]OHA38015.1 MAG: hypothetical protein A3H58_01645 [Candi
MPFLPGVREYEEVAAVAAHLMSSQGWLFAVAVANALDLQCSAISAAATCVLRPLRSYFWASAHDNRCLYL